MPPQLDSNRVNQLLGLVNQPQPRQRSEVRVQKLLRPGIDQLHVLLREQV